MRRLLWKEWHEIRWYLACLLVLPWLLGLWSRVRGYWADDVFVFEFLVVSCLIAFWGATRVSKDMQANHMSVQWLPVSRWRLWSAKFMPGLVTAGFIPFWVWIAVAVCMKHPGLPQFICASGSSTMEEILSTTSMAIGIYAWTFAASVFLPSLAAALVGPLVMILVFGFLVDQAQGTLPTSGMIVMIAVLAIAVSASERARSVGSGAWSRALAAVRAILIGLIPAVAIGLIVSIISVGGWPRLAGQFESLRQFMFRGYVETERQPWSVSNIPYIVSPDGRQTAYFADMRMMDKGERNRVQVSDIYGHSVMVPDPTATPAAWLPNGNLLVYTGISGREITVSEFNPRTRLLTRLVSFTPQKKNPRSVPILGVYPEPSGNRVAMAVRPSFGGGWDIWVYDRRTRSLRILYPGVLLTGFSAGFTWDGDSLVISRMSEFWRFPLDGSAPRHVAVSVKEVSRD